MQCIRRRLAVAIAATVLAIAPFCFADPVGWRGDGTGHYPDATPPAFWSKTADGKTTNILWQKKFPHYSWASPLVVGDKLFVRSEPYDLVCLDRNSGKVLWVRAHGPNEAASDEDRKDPLWPEVTASRTAVVRADQSRSAGTSAASAVG